MKVVKIIEQKFRFKRLERKICQLTHDEAIVSGIELLRHIHSEEAKYGKPNLKQLTNLNDSMEAFLEQCRYRWNIG
jgi:hypothetical protein